MNAARVLGKVIAVVVVCHSGACLEDAQTKKPLEVFQDAVRHAKKLSSAMPAMDDRATVNAIIARLGANGPGWVADTRAVLFAHETPTDTRAIAAVVLADVQDRQSFELLLEKLAEAPYERIPTPAAISVLGRVARRKDVPRLIQLLRSDSTWVRMCASWGLFGATAVYFGSPDMGLANMDLHTLWTDWWQLNNSRAKTDWFRNGAEQCLQELKLTAPMVRARAGIRARALMASFDRNAWIRYGTCLGFQTWWRRTGENLIVDEAWCVARGDPRMILVDSFDWDSDPYWGAETDTFEAYRSQELKRLVALFQDEQVLTASLVDRVSVLTNLPNRAFPEPQGGMTLDEVQVIASDTSFDAAKRKAWRDWYARCGDALVWDWAMGHFVRRR